MIVSNTTPISNFLHLERMDILQELFGTIHIPYAVKQEIEEYFHSNSLWHSCLQKEIICVHNVQTVFILNDPLHILHQGEVEALSLYLEQHANLCLLDDNDARKVATLHNINVTGTLGILIEAKKRGVFPAVKPFMKMLKEQHTFWITEKMFQHVLSLADEE